MGAGGGSAQFFKVATSRVGWGVNFSYGELANFLDMQNTDQYYIELSIKCCFFLVSQVSNMVVLSKIIMQLKFLLLDI